MARKKKEKVVAVLDATSTPVIEDAPVAQVVIEDAAVIEDAPVIEDGVVIEDEAVVEDGVVIEDEAVVDDEVVTAPAYLAVELMNPLDLAMMASTGVMLADLNRLPALPESMRHQLSTLYETIESLEQQSAEPWKGKGILLGGGGVKGLAQLGYLKERFALKPGERDEIRRWCGVSIGAIVALLMAIDYDVDDLIRVFVAMASQNILPFDPQVSDTSGVACFSDQRIRAVLQKLLTHRHLSLDMTYAQFSDELWGRFGKTWEALVYCVDCAAMMWVRPHGETMNVSTMTSENETSLDDDDDDDDDNVDDHRPVHRVDEWTVWDVLRGSIGVPVCFAPHASKVQPDHRLLDGMTKVYSLMLMTEVHARMLEEMFDTTMVLLETAQSKKRKAKMDDFMSALWNTQRMAPTDPEWLRYVSTVHSDDLLRRVDMIVCPSVVSAMQPESVSDPRVQELLLRAGQSAARDRVADDAA